MCGITGMFAGPGTDVRQSLEALTARLSHRGPDGSGFQWWGPEAGFGHRRLSIVDLAGGGQPMANEDGKVWVTYNGEIYNHLPLRRELESLGHDFRTDCDTEVLVHGWEEWGPGLLERLNGIYAFGLHDARGAGPAKVWLARDPVGVKPLYLGKRRGTWWFASELAAARDTGLLADGFRADALDEYLVYRFIPSPGTFYHNAWKVPPGHFVSLGEGDTPRFRPFKERFAPAVLPGTRGEWEEALRGGLRDAVARQLMSDVPVGSMLSGGVDSTVITRFMRDMLPVPPQAFAIGFEQAEERELPLARRSAAALGVPLLEVEASEDDYLEEWPRQVAAWAEPFANSGVQLIAMLCRVIARTHKVVLTGQGADEPLGGYPRHTGERWYSLLRRIRPLLDLTPERWLESDRLRRIRRLAAEPEQALRFTELLAVFSPREALSLTGHNIEPAALAEPVRARLPADNNGDGLNRLLHVDARLSLADDLLLTADHTSMASSVELRVPFLDLEFFSLLERMPSHFKVSSLGERKWLYRRAVTPLLPKESRSQSVGVGARFGQKFGFTTPMNRWFKAWVHSAAESYLLGTESLLPSFVRGDRVRDLLTSVRDRGAPRSRQLLALFVLEAWLRGATATGQTLPAFDDPRTRLPA